MVIRNFIKSISLAAWAIIGLSILLAIACVVAWYRGNHSPPNPPKTQYIYVPQVKEVEKIKRVEIPVEKIVVIEKNAAVSKLDLPDEIKNDNNKQVTASGVVPPYDGDTNVLAIIDTQTGVSSISAKQVPLPFFDFEMKRAIGVRYGYSTKYGSQADAYGRIDFFRIAGIHLGVYGEINSTGDAKGMFQTEYRW